MTYDMCGVFPKRIQTGASVNTHVTTFCGNKICILSNVTIMDKATSCFHQYLLYCQKSVITVFSMVNAIMCV